MNFNRSRSTVREIPIQRELNPFGVSQSSVTGVMSGLPHQGGTTTAWTTTRYDPVTGNPQQEEYYRREVNFDQLCEFQLSLRSGDDTNSGYSLN